MRTAENPTYMNTSSTSITCVTSCVISKNIKAACRTTQTGKNNLSSHLDVTLQLPQYFKNSLQILYHRKLFPHNRVGFLQSYLSPRLKGYDLVCGYSEFFCTETGVVLKIRHTLLWLSTKTYVLRFQKGKIWGLDMYCDLGKHFVIKCCICEVIYEKIVLTYVLYLVIF